MGKHVVPDLLQPQRKKPGSFVEIVALLVLVGISIWVPRQESLFDKDKIVDAQNESSSYLNFVETSSLLMTSDKVVLPDAWTKSSADEGVELRVLKLRSKQVRFVQNTEVRSPATESSEPHDFWVVESVKRLGESGQVEVLDVADVDGERTTPYVELGTGSNDFSVVYHLHSDRSRILRKKIRLIPASNSDKTGAR